MYYLDHRLSKILSDIRLDEAQSLRKSQQRRQSQGARQRLGLLLIAQGEKLAGRQAKAA